MNTPTEAKIIFTGTVGVGKTTAIRCISAIEPVNTEALASDEVAQQKKTTTVGMDYGEIQIDEQLTLRLYGTPGQERFSFMWDILAKGALGIIILIDNTRPDPIADMTMYLDNFREYILDSAAVIAVTRTEKAPQPSLNEYHQCLIQRGEMYPLTTADTSRREDVLMLLDTLFSSLELS